MSETIISLLNNNILSPYLITNLMAPTMVDDRFFRILIKGYKLYFVVIDILMNLTGGV